MKYSDYAKIFIGVVQGSTKHKHIINEYNKIKPLPRSYRVKINDNWCATFVSFVLKSCGVKKNVFECGAQRMCDRFKKFKLLISDTTKGQKDDIIFYDWQCNGWIDHVGIIYRVTKDSYVVIEGNKNKKVATRTIKKTDKHISAIGRIK